MAGNEEFPRFGHQRDLHDWAQQLDAEQAGEIEAQRTKIKATLLEATNASGLDSNTVLALIDELEKLAVQSKWPYKMADVFDGEAYNG